MPSNINVEEEDSSIAKTYKDQGLSEASKVLEEEENSLSFGNKSEAEDSIHDLNETVGNLTVSEPKMSASYLSLEAKSPFMLYAYTEDYQKMVAVDLLVRAVDKDKFQVKMTKCGRYLHIYRAVPDIFLDLTRQRRAEKITRVIMRIPVKLWLLMLWSRTLKTKSI